MSHNTTTTEHTPSNKIHHEDGHSINHSNDQSVTDTSDGHHTHDIADSSQSHKSTSQISSNNERDQQSSHLQTIDDVTIGSHDVIIDENMQTDQLTSANLSNDKQATHSDHSQVTKDFSDNQTESHDNMRMDMDSDDPQENQREFVSHNEQQNTIDSASKNHHLIKRASLTGGDSTQNQLILTPVTSKAKVIVNIPDVPLSGGTCAGPLSPNEGPIKKPPTPEPLPIVFGDRSWLALQFHDENKNRIKKPNELEVNMGIPNGPIDKKILNRIQGSIIGMALGDALGAHVEFRPREFLMQKPVTQMEAGGTWGLSEGQFTDDTSMALCLANSLIASNGFNPYDQLVRYKWWYHHGYMSSTGVCFDIGAATRNSIQEFQHRQKELATKFNIPMEQIDYVSDPEVLEHLNVYCSYDDVAGNGALMRLAPVPLFFYNDPAVAVELSGYSGEITHGDRKAYDACRYYGALIVAALHDATKDELLDKDFYVKHKDWFGQKELHPDIESIAKGSYQRGGYDAGIRGKGYIVNALEAALWAFWSDGDSFEKGALAAVNLGDDTDTTAAIYGQLAGAYYGYDKLPAVWLEQVYAKVYMEKLSKWIAYEGKRWKKPCSTPISE